MDIQFTPTAPALHQRILLAAQRLAATSKDAARKFEQIRAEGAAKGWNN